MQIIRGTGGGHQGEPGGGKLYHGEAMGGSGVAQQHPPSYKKRKVEKKRPRREKKGREPKLVQRSTKNNEERGEKKFQDSTQSEGKVDYTNW